MNEKIWNDIEVDFLNKIYNYKGAVGVDDLFHMLKSSYGLKGDLFNKILGMIMQKEYCIIEKIRKLDNAEEEIIFVFEQVYLKFKLSDLFNEKMKSNLDQIIKSRLLSIILHD